MPAIYKYPVSPCYHCCNSSQSYPSVLSIVIVILVFISIFSNIFSAHYINIHMEFNLSGWQNDHTQTWGVLLVLKPGGFQSLAPGALSSCPHILCAYCYYTSFLLGSMCVTREAKLLVLCLALSRNCTIICCISKFHFWTTFLMVSYILPV
jgi:hypothetical protein